jgi:uncharacterized protein YbaR (Trm112 family)
VSPHSGHTAHMLAFDPAVLMPLLRCPVSQAPLRLVGEEWLVSTDADTRMRYPIAEGIPVLLEEEATALDESAWRELLDQAAPAAGEQG